MPTDIAKYSIELFKPGGEGTGIEEIPGRLIMLCDGTRVLARSDRPEPR
jgi:hypothetical protein